MKSLGYFQPSAEPGLFGQSLMNFELRISPHPISLSSPLPACGWFAV